MSGSPRLTHVDGLRGVAIIFIILFHAYPNLFSRGYHCVDVFLVISGFLLFLKPARWRNDRILSDLSDFISKKLTRLVFPLSIIVALSVGLGIFLLLPDYVQRAASTGFTALLGVSNIFLSHVSNDYFALDTGSNPLVHTWYLSVLIQIYVCYAVGNIVLRKASRKTILTLLFAIGLASLFCSFLNEILRGVEALLGEKCYVSSPFDYYSTILRLWPVLAGGAIHLLPETCGRHLRKTLPVVCLFLIIILSACPLFGSSAFTRLLIVLATMVCMRYGANSVCAAMLNLRPLQWVGMRSFSLYLVHMPVIAFYRSAPRGGVIGDLIVLVGIFLLSMLFFRTVERHKPSLKKMAVFWCISLLLVGGERMKSFSVNIWDKCHCYPLYSVRNTWKIPENTDDGRAYNAEKLKGYSGVFTMARNYNCERSKSLVVGCPGVPSFVLVGDSHASSLFFGLDKECERCGLSGLYLRTYIVPLYGWQNKIRAADEYYSDSEKNDAFFSWLAAHPEIRTVIIAQDWQQRWGNGHITRPETGVTYSREEALCRFVAKVGQLGRKSVLVSQAPILRPASPDYVIQPTTLAECICTEEEYRMRSLPYMSMLKSLAGELGCSVLPAYEALFRDGPLYAVEDGEYMMRDRGHLSPKGSEKAACGYIGMLQKILEAPH